MQYVLSKERDMRIAIIYEYSKEISEKQNCGNLYGNRLFVFLYFYNISLFFHYFVFHF